MVHGFTAEAAPNWAIMGPGLAAAGFRTVTFRYASLTIGAELAAAAMATRVRAISGPVALLGHSRAAWSPNDLGGCAGRISHWFNISGVNNGTAIRPAYPATPWATWASRACW